MWIDGGCMKAGRTGAALATVLAALKGAGYTVLHRPLNAKDWLPQQRERLYVERRIYVFYSVSAICICTQRK